MDTLTQSPYKNLAQIKELTDNAPPLKRTKRQRRQDVTLQTRDGLITIEWAALEQSSIWALASKIEEINPLKTVTTWLYHFQPDHLHSAFHYTIPTKDHLIVGRVHCAIVSSGTSFWKQLLQSCNKEDAIEICQRAGDFKLSTSDDTSQRNAVCRAAQMTGQTIELTINRHESFSEHLLFYGRLIAALKIEGMRSIDSQEDFETIIENCPNIQHLVINLSPSVNFIPTLDFLTSFTYDGGIGGNLAEIDYQPKLERLTLKNAHCISYLSELPLLKHLKLSNTSLWAVHTFPSLETLNLESEDTEREFELQDQPKLTRLTHPGVAVKLSTSLKDQLFSDTTALALCRGEETLSEKGERGMHLQKDAPKEL